jgi:rhodanese-related sulfurtransferase
MAFSEDQIRANRAYFAAKLAAERQKADVVKKVNREAGAPDFVLVDTRSRDAFAQGHIRGAVNVPVAELAQLAQKLPKEKELVTYCWNHT